jgi:hypothetical protein
MGLFDPLFPSVGRAPVTLDWTGGIHGCPVGLSTVIEPLSHKSSNSLTSSIMSGVHMREMSKVGLTGQMIYRDTWTASGVACRWCQFQSPKSWLVWGLFPYAYRANFDFSSRPCIRFVFVLLNASVQMSTCFANATSATATRKLYTYCLVSWESLH